MIYEKWRDLSINLFDIKFNNIKLKEIISYPPAGNDVVEAICLIDGKEQNVFIKYERSKMADFICYNSHMEDLLKCCLQLHFNKRSSFLYIESQNYFTLSI